jgi:hypothetical protein
MKKIITTVATIALLSSSAIAESISTYLIGTLASTADVQSKLKANGFKVLATTNNVVTITNSELQATNTYLATLQVYVGGSDVRVQNPAYFGAAYLDDKYKKDQFKATVDSLKKALGDLKGSSEKLDAEDLGGYHFMMGMPYFDEPITVSKANKVYEKITGNKHIAYSLTLPNGSILVGHKLTPSTNAFLKILNQTKNSQILPYEALVFSNQVKIMNPKFYLALSLPQLSMGQFMQISDVPDEIEKDITNAYK